MCCDAYYAWYHIRGGIYGNVIVEGIHTLVAHVSRFVAGKAGTAIGEMMGVDYSAVSVGRKRLRGKLKSDKHLSQIIKRVEADLSTIMTPSPPLNCPTCCNTSSGILCMMAAINSLQSSSFLLISPQFEKAIFYHLYLCQTKITKQKLTIKLVT